jgi:hypothetical protein
MALAAKEMPKLPQRLAGQLEDLINAPLSPERIREDIARVQRTTREGYENYCKVITKIHDDMVGLLKQGAQFDIDPVIQGLIETEGSNAKERQRAEKAMTEILRIAAKSRPDLLSALNEALSAELSDINRLAELHRDARWRLMEARAFYQPSEGIGAIRGQHTDLEDLLKN